jgi:eukaryotic-like serine/threonine-protein kinase
MDAAHTPAGGATGRSTPSTLADYRITGHLGDGGHGRFLLAEPPARLGLGADPVVVKVVDAAGDAAFRRFTRELTLFARVASPRLVRLYDAGQHDDCFFYSMEYCTAGSLAESASAMSHGDRLRAVATVARAAHDLHETGIVHRNIRPGTALLRGDGSACLSDLTLAKAGGGSLTAFAPVSAIGFVDPATIAGESAGRHTDVYAIGALLHHALTGAGVHPAASGVEPMLAIRNALTHPPHVDRAALRAGEADLVEACVARDVEHRPATAAEVADLIDTLIEAPIDRPEAS